MYNRFRACRVELPADLGSWKQEYFPKALALLDRESSVGNSVMKAYGADIGTALGWDGLEYNPDRVEFLRLVVMSKIDGLLDGTGVADPLNVFIKDEPHSEAKVAEGRHRLILAVSLEDAMVDRMLFCELQASVVDQHWNLPIKIGWSFHAGGYKRLFRSFNTLQKVALDRSGWDWMVPPYLVSHWRAFLLDMIIETPSWARTLIERRLDLLFEPGLVCRFRDGVSVVQDVTGIMKSGCYLTLLLNSVSQVILHRMALILLDKEDCDAFFVTMGDDTLQGYVSWLFDYLATLRSMGVSLKDPVIAEYAEFCGFAFDDRHCVPVYWKKHLHKVVCDVRESWVDTMADYIKLYGHSPGVRRFLVGLLKRFSPQRIPPDWLVREFLEG